MTTETNSEMKEMMGLGKNMKTYIIIMLIWSKMKRNMSIRREMEDISINGIPRDDKISEIKILLDMVNSRLETAEEIVIKLEDIEKEFIQNQRGKKELKKRVKKEFK